MGVVVLNFLFDEVQDLLEFLVRNMHGRLEFALAKVENTYLSESRSSTSITADCCGSITLIKLFA